MASAYTHKQLTEVENVAAKAGFDGMEVRFGTGDLEAEETGFSHHRLAPGARQPFGHHHDHAEEVYVVISGSGRIKLDDEILELSRLDAVRIAPGAMRNLEAGPEGMEVLAFGPRHQGDAATVPGWWSD